MPCPYGLLLSGFKNSTPPILSVVGVADNLFDAACGGRYDTYLWAWNN